MVSSISRVVSRKEDSSAMATMREHDSELRSTSIGEPTPSGELRSMLSLDLEDLEQTDSDA